jgi:hypothetical protein
MLCH